MNKVLLTGRLTRDPEMRGLASGKNVTTFTVASNEFFGGGKEKAEYHAIVTWDRLAEIAGRYLGKGQQVAIEGRLQTRSWDDERGALGGGLAPGVIGCLRDRLCLHSEVERS